MEVNAYVRHGFTPGRTPFADGTRCVVMLARYPCPYGPDEHDPALPPVDVDAFGRKRNVMHGPPPHVHRHQWQVEDYVCECGDVAPRGLWK